MRSASQIEAEAAGWIARRELQSWSEEQQLQMDAWLEASTAHRVAYLRLDSMWKRADGLSLAHVPGQNSVPTNSVPIKIERLSRFSTWRIAASFFLVAAIGSLVAYTVLDRPDSYETTLGESKQVALADGSHLTLNTDTHLQTQLTKEKRTVWLESGEAYFEVAHDVTRPFVVEAGDSRITVLGTKFSVRRDSGHVNVVVVDGRVQVSPVGKNAVSGTKVVTKDDTVVADNGNLVVAKKTAREVVDQLSWRQGMIVLDEMTLGQAATEFNRYNHRKLIVVDSTASQIRLGGSFRVDNVEGFARLLHDGFGLRLEIGKDEIKILG